MAYKCEKMADIPQPGKSNDELLIIGYKQKNLRQLLYIVCFVYCMQITAIDNSTNNFFFSSFYYHFLWARFNNVTPSVWRKSHCRKQII